MKLQYYTSIYTDTEDVLHLLANKKEIPNVPFDTECQGRCYSTVTMDGRKACLIIEENKYMNVFY